MSGFSFLLKRAKVRPTDNDIINFYCTCIRLVLEYCLLFFHHSIPAYLGDLEHVQKHALSIISPGVSHHRNLKLFNLSTLSDRCQELCGELFESVVSDPSHKLPHLPPPRTSPSITSYSMCRDVASLIGKIIQLYIYIYIIYKYSN